MQLKDITNDLILAKKATIDSGKFLLKEKKTVFSFKALIRISFGLETFERAENVILYSFSILIKSETSNFLNLNSLIIFLLFEIATLVKLFPMSIRRFIKLR